MEQEHKMLCVEYIYRLVDEKCAELKEQQRAARIRADIASLVANSELSNEKKLDMLIWINEELWNQSKSTEEA